MEKAIMNALRVAFAFAAFSLLSTPLQAMPVASAPGWSTDIVQVADGCGQGRYRGPGGACHRFGRGPNPGGNFAGAIAVRAVALAITEVQAVHATVWGRVPIRADTGPRVEI